MQKTFIMGDIHGDSTPIREIVQKHPTFFSDGQKHFLILLGDAGLNYWCDEKRDKQLKKELSDLPFIYFVIRGNHEERPTNCMKQNPSKWQMETFFDNVVLVEKDFSNIKYATDSPAIYSIPANEYNLKTLVMGGAYSVDKMLRIQNGAKWFSDEQMTPEEMTHAKLLIEHEKQLDLILTHTCPSIMQPREALIQGKNIQGLDLAMERFFSSICFDSLYNQTQFNFKAWLFGHYHIFKDYLPSLFPNFQTPRFLALDWKYMIDLSSVMTDCISVF